VGITLQSIGKHEEALQHLQDTLAMKRQLYQSVPDDEKDSDDEMQESIEQTENLIKSYKTAV
jgi:hypothetical protein